MTRSRKATWLPCTTLLVPNIESFHSVWWPINIHTEEKRSHTELANNKRHDDDENENEDQWNSSSFTWKNWSTSGKSSGGIVVDHLLPRGGGRGGTIPMRCVGYRKWSGVAQDRQPQFYLANDWLVIYCYLIMAIVASFRGRRHLAAALRWEFGVRLFGCSAS